MYIREFRLNWRSLLAASIGLAFGSAMGHYLMNLFGPALIEEFGWSKAEYALVGSLPLILLVLVPVAGRFTDRFGTRVAAMVGFTAVPLGFLAFSMMGGSIIEFFAIWLIQHIFGVLTTTMVFARVVVERFDSARGFALSLMMTTPPLLAAFLVPALDQFIDEYGWRTGYQLLALLSASAGLVTILLMGRSKRSAPRDRAELHLSWQELASLIRHPVFLLIVGGMFLVNIPQVFAAGQIKLVMLDNGVSDNAATWAISLYAIGVIVGRFICGLSLDRLPANIVAITALGLPAIGFAILASSVTALWGLAFAVLLIGAAQGAEGDIGAFMVSRHFAMKNYSLLLSCLTAMIGAGSAIGSLIISAGQVTIGSYTPFLVVAAITTLLGAFLFFLTGRPDRAHAVPSLPPEPEIA